MVESRNTIVRLQPPYERVNVDMPHRELAYPAQAVFGSVNVDVKRLQEWLNLSGAVGCMIDSEFGPATRASLLAFQKKNSIEATGVLNELTWSNLVAPLLRAQAKRAIGSPFPQAIVEVAKAHLTECPREVGGDNRGPWVRAYCKGQDGPDFAWCQGFASSIWEQSAGYAGVPLPFPLYEGTTFSLYVPWVANSASKAKKLRGSAQIAEVTPGSMFFLRGGSAGYYHVGILTKWEPGSPVFETIEGNTNDDGSANGYEVCARIRSVRSCDFGLSI